MGSIRYGNKTLVVTGRNNEMKKSRMKKTQGSMTSQLSVLLRAAIARETKARAMLKRGFKNMGRTDTGNISDG